MSMKRFSKNILLVLVGLLAVGSCKRVPLYDSSSHIVLELQLKLNQDLTVSDTVDLNSYPQYYEKVHLKSPERLAACFYDVNTHQMVAKEYVGPTGGYITSVPSGTYDILVYELGTIVTQVDNNNMRGQIKALTSDITQSVSTRFLSKATKADANTDPVISEPDHLMVARLSGVFIPDHADIDETYVIHADGQSSVETYSFIVRNVKGFDQVRSVQALVTGQASSKFLWDGHNPTATVNLLTSAVADKTLKCFYGVYNTFGQIGGKVYLNFLVTSVNGDEVVFPVDVTDEVDNPDNVIVIDSLVIPPLSNTPHGGYNPTVDDWDDEVIDVPIQ